MNVVGKFSLGLTAALVMNWGVWAASAPLAAPAADSADAATAGAPAVDSNQPYATIVARNIFSLVPVPPPPPPPGPPEDPPPKITANGIMTVFGELQALFKVSLPGKGGQAAKDQSYMLSEGQRQDDIEVVKIDVKAATITFNNHGTEQEIPLETAKDSGPSGGMATPTAGGPPPGGGGFNPAIPRFRPRPGTPQGGMGFPGPGFGGGSPGGMPGGSPFQSQNNNNSGVNPSALPISGGGTAPAQQEAPPGSDLTPEQQALLIETQRAALLSQQEQGQKTEFPPEMLPPTALSPPEVTGGDTGKGLNP